MEERKKQQLAELALEHLREMQELVGDSQAEAKAAFLELYTWTPEWIENSEVNKLLTDSYHNNGAKKGQIPPFLCNLSVFELLGKEQSRAFGARLHALGEALGLTREEMKKAMDRGTEDTPREPEITKETPLSADDCDALEMLIRNNAAIFWKEEHRVQVQRSLRALQAVRKVYNASREEGWKFLQVLPSELKVGDKLLRRGSWSQVLGFLHDDKNRWSEQGSKHSETPVGGKEKTHTGQPKYYLVLTDWSPKCGEDLQAETRHVIQRYMGVEPK